MKAALLLGAALAIAVAACNAELEVLGPDVGGAGGGSATSSSSSTTTLDAAKCTAECDGGTCLPVDGGMECSRKP